MANISINIHLKVEFDKAIAKKFHLHHPKNEVIVVEPISQFKTYDQKINKTPVQTHHHSFCGCKYLYGCNRQMVFI